MNEWGRKAMAEDTDKVPRVDRSPRIDMAGVSKLSQHPIWDLLTKIAAPAAVIVSAASYLTGYMYRLVLFAIFGFDPNAIDISVQNTIALGYTPLAISLIVIASFLQLAFWFARLLDYPLGSYIRRINNGDLKHLKSSLIRFYRQMMLVNFFNAAAVTMFCAVVAGTLSGVIFASGYIKKLNNGCLKSCVHIVTTRGQFNGLIIAQSKDTSLIVSKEAAYLLPNSAILSVSPTGKRGWVPFQD
jgi:hypothetical protein